MTMIPIALIQFDAVPEQPARNVAKMTELTHAAVARGAHWVMFHEGTVCDYTPRVSELAEPVPDGPSTRAMIACAKELGCVISFGLTEAVGERHHISQLFVGPQGLLYRYRKTWLWRQADDGGYRNEWARYDPGTGPELFELEGVRATCFICADGEAPRCIERAAAVRPQVVFYPNNRGELPFDLFAQRAKAIGAPMLVTNRTGQSWIHACQGGCTVFSAQGETLAKANREGREEILRFDLKL